MSHVIRILRIVFACLFFTTMLHAQTSVSIHDIMTSLPNTPLLGQNVKTSGIVVGVVTGSTTSTNGGFYISLATYDSDVNTSEGIFVSSSSVTACNAVAVGDVATVTGIVTNSTTPNLTAANTPGTYIAPTACSTSGTSSMTQTISVSSVLTTFGDALKYTGMAVSNTSFYAVQPTTGSVSGSAVVSSGQFWATLASNSSTNNHIFRSTGIAGDEYKPSSAPTGVPTWSGNPQRVLIDTTSFGGTAVDITVGQTITCTNKNTSGLGATNGIGVVDYTLGYARIMIFKTVTCTVSGTVATSVSAAADTTHFKVGTLDVNSFLGSSSLFATALSKATLAVTNVFGSPDIFAMQEVGDQTTLQSLATAVNTANGGTTTYTASVVGTDTINNGFLINTTTFKNTSFTEVGRSATYTTAAGGSAALWEHPPLVCTGEFVRTGKNYPVTILNVHMAVRDNIGDSSLGADVRIHRAAQAAAISTLVQQYQSGGANVIVAGNFNGYEYNDGYVDVVGVVDGSPAASTAVTLYQATNTTAALHDFTTDVTANTRYNIIERGNAASLEHILASSTVTDSSTASASLASYVNVVTQPHFSTDYAATNANSTSTPAGLTPHDGFLVNFAIPPVPTTASVSPTSINFGDVSLAHSASQTVTVTNTTTFTSTVTISNIAISGTNASDFTQTSTCTSLSEGSTCTVTVTFTPSATGTRTGTLTITNDSTSNPTLTVSLTGNGIDTTATLTPTTATFANTYAGGGVSAAQTFTVTNTSAVTIAVNSAVVTTGFTLASNNCTTSLAAGATCTMTVTFTPTTTGAQTGTLTVTTNTSANATLTATLNGTGLPTTATLTPTSASYGTQIVGTSSAATVFTWSNTSSVALTISSVAATGDYSVSTTTCSGQIAANSSCTISVVFTPTALKTRTGTLTVVSTSTANATLTASLTGVGVADVESDVSSLSFGNIDVGYSSTAQTVTITNYTSTAIALTGITITGDYADTTTCGSSLAGKSSCTVSVIFTPTGTGTRTGTLSITTNDTKYPLITVALTGNGVDFSIALTPASGTTIAGETVSGIAVTTTAIGGFNAQVALTCTTKAGGSTCSLSPSTFTLSGTTTSAMTITTTSKYTVIGYGSLLPIGTWGGGWRMALLNGLGGLCTGLLVLARRRGRQVGRLMVALLALGLIGGLSGCGSKSPDRNSTYTEPGTYDYTVTVTDGKISHSTTYSLAVTAK